MPRSKAGTQGPKGGKDVATAWPDLLKGPLYFLKYISLDYFNLNVYVKVNSAHTVEKCKGHVDGKYIEDEIKDTMIEEPDRLREMRTR